MLLRLLNIASVCETEKMKDVVHLDPQTTKVAWLYVLRAEKIALYLFHAIKMKILHLNKNVIK